MSSEPPKDKSITFPPFPVSLKLAKRGPEQKAAGEPGQPPAPPATDPNAAAPSSLTASPFASRDTAPPFPAQDASSNQRPQSAAPFVSDAALNAAWDQLYRARALLVDEQNNLRKERLSIEDREAQMKHKEEVMAAREKAAAEREAAIAAATPPPAPATPAGESAVSKLTRAPFEIARSVFGPKK